jgi:hypothetical protein
MRSDLIYILSFLPGFTSDRLSQLSNAELMALYEEYIL